MLKLYAVNVWHNSKPRHVESIQVRTYTAKRAAALAIESYPGCDARTAGVLLEGKWCASERSDFVSSNRQCQQ
jgi:hypothetical protein